MTEIICGDCRAEMARMEAGSVQCVVTSPPYWGLRDYGLPPLDWGDWQGSLGLEPTPELFVAHIVEVFRAVKRVLRDDGSVWLNMGDGYANDTKWGGTTGGKHAKGLHGKTGIGRTRTSTGSKPGDLLGMPWRVAFALQADGWYLRKDIIWAKGLSFCPTYSGSVMPESVNGTRWERCRVKVGTSARAETSYAGGASPQGAQSTFMTRAGREGRIPCGAEWKLCPGCPKCEANDGLVLRQGSWRPTSAHEHLFELTKKPGAFFDAEAVREAAQYGFSETSGNHAGSIGGLHSSRTVKPGLGGTRNLRDVWAINPQPFTGWTRTSRWVPVERDAVCDGTTRITSPDCPEHAGRSVRASTDGGGGRVVDGSIHTGCKSNHPAPVLPDGCAPIGQLPEQGTGPGSSDSPGPSCSRAATDRSTQSRRTAPSPETSPPCTPCAGTDAHTGGRPESPESAAPHANTRESSTLPDEMDAHSLAETEHHTVDSSSLPISQKCQCSFYQETSQETSHFATFPEKLVEPCILAGTSPKACGVCGAPGARVVESWQVIESYTQGRRGDAKRPPDQRTDLPSFKSSKATRTHGFRPTCECKRPTHVEGQAHPGTIGTVPGDRDGPTPLRQDEVETLNVGRCLVLDPFAGSGTVGLVCKRLGRDFVGIELNPDYCEMARKRLAEPVTLELFT